MWFRFYKRFVLVMSILVIYSATIDQFSTSAPWGSLTPFAEADSGAMRNEPLQLALSVNWEGSHIREHNLQALLMFRRVYPHLSMLHFVSPGYFTKPAAKRLLLKDQIMQAVNKGDEIGISLQSWKSVVQSAGVPFRHAPTFWGNEISAKSCRVDCGVDVPLSAYESNELDRIFAGSIKALDDLGFPRPRIMYVNGWMASRPVLEAAAKHNIEFDFSAVSQRVVKQMLGVFPLFSWLEQTWSNVEPGFTPFTVKTAHGVIHEVGNSLASIDYSDTEELLALFNDVFKMKAAQPKRKLVMHLAVNQETAAQYLPRLLSVMPQVYRMAAAKEVDIVPFALPKSKK